MKQFLNGSQGANKAMKKRPQKPWVRHSQARAFYGGVIRGEESTSKYEYR